MKTLEFRARFMRRLLASLFLLLALFVALWFSGRWYLARSTMPMSGEIAMSGLQDDVEVLFDGRGIPRIYSKSDVDAFRALGWLHAGERLFQMELIRRVARGEIAEIVGPRGLESDFLHRQIGFARRVELESPTLPLDIERRLSAYVEGINQYIEQRPLPPSFIFLRLKPEPWAIKDVLTLAYYQTWSALPYHHGNDWRGVVDVHGEAAADWLLSLPEWSESSVPPGQMNDASNTWVVSALKSASGHALHAADPHLDISSAPGIWYAAGLHSVEGLDVIGITVPGLPLIASGHNGQIAFALTNAPIDLLEWYALPFVSADRNVVMGPDGPEVISSRTETFRVRGSDEVIERELRFTAQGIVIEEQSDQAIILHWAGFDLAVDGMLRSALSLIQAQDFDQFRDAVSDMGAFSVNWSFSDRDGNIGYVQSSPIPKRRHDRFFQILDGTNADHYWAGYVEPEARPFAFNPAQHWLANANNHASSEHNGWPIPGFYRHWRMHRATHLLSQDRFFDRDDMLSMQLDQRSDSAMEWKGVMAEAAERAGRPALADELRSWDAIMAPESELAGLYAAWWAYLPQQLFASSGTDDGRAGETTLYNWMNQLPEEPAIAAMPLAEAADRALDDALDHGIQPLGSIQKLVISHPLASVALLDHWLDLSRGPFSIGGSETTLNATFPNWNGDQTRLLTRQGASMRFIMDWSDPDSFSLNLAVGQSGHPLSPHFDDFLDDFLSGTPWVVPLDRDLMTQRATSGLRMMARKSAE